MSLSTRGKHLEYGSKTAISCIKDLSYLHIRNIMDSKTSTGPVAPTIVNGWPANSEYNRPQVAPEISISIVPCIQQKQCY